MTRKRRSKDNAEATKTRVRSFRSRERRERRVKEDASPSDPTWLIRSSARMAAMQIINDRHYDRPYWLSIPYEGGPEPIGEFYPCSSVRRGNRLFYGFMFREHRDAIFEKWENARKEFTRS